MAAPFNFPEADIFLEEDVRVDNWDNGNRKVLALWDLQKVRDYLLTVKVIKTELDLLNSVIPRLTVSIQKQEWSIVEDVIKDLHKFQRGI